MCMKCRRYIRVYRVFKGLLDRFKQDEKGKCLLKCYFIDTNFVKDKNVLSQLFDVYAMDSFWLTLSGHKEYKVGTSFTATVTIEVTLKQNVFL